MFKFDKEQTVFDIAGVKMGGQPGEYPTVLCGFLFYYGQDIISDEKIGEFDKSKAESLVNNIEELSDDTGNPYILMAIGETEAIPKYVEYIGEICDAPFIVRAHTEESRIAGAQYADEVGLADRAIYESINITTTKSEISALAETDISSSIILGFNPENGTLAGKMAIWENGDEGVYEKGLLEAAEDCGIDKFMMDAAMMPMGQGAGTAIRAILAEKIKWGYPVGAGIHEAPTIWDWLREYRRSGNMDVYKVCEHCSNVMPIMCGADYLSFGFIENANLVFPLVAQTDMLVAESLEGYVETIENHPINKLL